MSHSSAPGPPISALMNTQSVMAVTRYCLRITRLYRPTMAPLNRVRPRLLAEMYSGNLDPRIVSIATRQLDLSLRAFEVIQHEQQIAALAREVECLKTELKMGKATHSNPKPGPKARTQLQ